ncbi:hypothetical protein WJX84_008815 [Apatococcus fuscideae]|uniref:Aminotransferase class I/classII large domain-containing protein n=1 Tax=Apatococcus fuscideae TaxID=2026836 RepID=A0AAW1T918_9CHLO
MCERPVTVQLAWNDWLTDTLGHLKAAQLQRQLRPLGYQDLPVEAVAESQDVPLWLGSSVTPDLLPGNLPLTLFSSNDYLGLSAHPAVRHAAAESALRHGLGPRASPVVGGHTPQHAALQATLARLCGTETAMLFPTGFAANLACLPALGGSKDVIIFSDALNHASIIDGTRLACRAGATVQVYVHADAAHLEQLLQAAPTNKRKIVVTDSVFSMDGDLAPLVELAHLKQRFGFLLVIDEAHATLMMGQKGAGLAEALGVEEHIDLHVGTLSKAVGAQGGFIACSHAIREVLLTKSRSFVYSTAPALPIVAAVQAAIDTAEREPEHRQRLWARIQQFSRLTGLQSPSPVFPIILGSEAAALNFSQQLLQLGFYVPAIRPPTVPKGTSRLRISLSAAHSEGDVAALSRSQGLQPLAQRLLGELVAVAGTWRVPRRGHSFESGLSLAAPTYMIWGANTGVGKTLVAAGLAAAVRRSRGQLLYLKPVQSGYPQDCDSRLPATLADVQQEGAEKADELADIQPGRSYAKTLHAWHTPVGPHLAAQLEGQFVSDEKILQDTRRHLNHFHSSAGPGSIALVETAGGVSSPTPSNTVQCEAWQGLSLPAILVGDGRLGGISATLSAQDSLNLRGHTTAAVVVSEVDGLDNSSALRRHLGTSPLGHQVPVLELPALPQAPTRGSDTPAVDAALQAWLGASAAQFDSLLHLLHDSHAQRVQSPSCSVPLRPPPTPSGGPSLSTRPWAGSGDLPGRDVKARLDMQYDACASWWTQGVSAHLQPKIVQAMAHAAGRWGHVIFPESTHEPALECTRLLLQGPGKGWASRVFFSDNGSTAIEVALKMAFRKFMADNQYFLSSWQSSVDKGSSPPQLGVLGLTNAYHGDTLGTMDAVAPSPYNGIKQTPWYTARGHRSIASIYDDYIEEQMDVYHRHGAGAKEHRSVGACIIEPVMQGAGGMIIPDPAFQRSMVCVCRKKGIPVIFDEVFSGLWRLGTASAAERLGVRPDIACFAKLLTGGMIPLAVTLATAPVFAAFQNDSKLLALLHGHSYSAHATGCAAAVAAMRIYSDPEQNPNLCHPAYRDRCHQSPACSQPCGRLLELWDLKVVQKLSKQVDVVQHVVAIGTVLAITLRTEPGQQGSYGLESAKIVTRQLKQRGIYARPLGNVVYVMCTPTTSRKQCATLLDDVVSVIIN